MSEAEETAPGSLAVYADRWALIHGWGPEIAGRASLKFWGLTGADLVSVPARCLVSAAWRSLAVDWLVARQAIQMECLAQAKSKAVQFGRVAWNPELMQRSLLALIME